MSVYYLAEIEDEYDTQKLKVAGGKARLDLLTIFKEMGFRRVDAKYPAEMRNGSMLNKINGHFRAYEVLKSAFECMHEDDTVIIQLPLETHTVLFGRLLGQLRHNGVRIIVFVHDLEFFRNKYRKDIPAIQKVREVFEERRALIQANCIVAHNESMKSELCDDLCLPGQQIESLGLFDYLTDFKPADFNDRAAFEAPVIIAGNLAREKAGFIYELPTNQSFALYGINYRPYETQENVEYRGSYGAEDLPSQLKGSYGLVWDGPSRQTCSGAYGEYLRINNPHKTSLYLAAGIPVIAWDESAVADYVTEMNVGLSVKSLGAIHDAINSVAFDEYCDMRSNARTLSKQLRAGYFTKRAVEAALRRRI